MGTEIGQYLIIQLFKQFKKKKINEIYTAARWDGVDILSFFKSIGFDRSNFINLRKELDSWLSTLLTLMGEMKAIPFSKKMQWLFTKSHFFLDP